MTVVSYAFLCSHFCEIRCSSRVAPPSLALKKWSIITQLKLTSPMCFLLQFHWSFLFPSKFYFNDGYDIFSTGQICNILCLFLSPHLDYVLLEEKAHVPTLYLHSKELSTKQVAIGHPLQRLPYNRQSHCAWPFRNTKGHGSSAMM